MQTVEPNQAESNAAHGVDIVTEKDGNVSAELRAALALARPVAGGGADNV